jgi:hypothetical protein
MLGLRLAELPDGRRAAIIRTSDRISFKQCRRKWAFSSHLKQNLAPTQLAAPLWFGSAIHYALEDYHGYNYFGRPTEAFKAYCLATARNYKRDLPPDAKEHYELGIQMMDYYPDTWLEGYGRKPDATYWDQDPTTGELIPQVEVNFEIPIPVENYPILRAYCERLGIDVVLYRGTLDRVAIDEYGHLWIVEYKTAKVYQQQHFLTDPQVTTYVWAAHQIYDRPIAGVIYHQFVKKAALGPHILRTTGLPSTASNLVCSSVLYKRTLENLFGTVQKSHHKCQEKYLELLKAETSDRDRYIIRDKVPRNIDQCQHEAQKILMELEDMLNPDLPLYPNPVRECNRMCSFVSPCVSMDDGSDWELEIAERYSERDQHVDRMWRHRLPDPKTLAEETLATPDLFQLQMQALQDAEAEANADAYNLARVDAEDFGPSDYDIAREEDRKAFPMGEDGSYNLAQVP